MEVNLSISEIMICDCCLLWLYVATQRCRQWIYVAHILCLEKKCFASRRGKTCRGEDIRVKWKWGSKRMKRMIRMWKHPINLTFAQITRKKDRMWPVCGPVCGLEIKTLRSWEEAYEAYEKRGFTSNSSGSGEMKRMWSVCGLICDAAIHVSSSRKNGVEATLFAIQLSELGQAH